MYLPGSHFQHKAKGTALSERGNSVLQAGNSRVLAYFLAVYLGPFGIHNFYLGFMRKGLIQLLITLFVCGVGPIVCWVWALTDAARLDNGIFKRFKIDAGSEGIPLEGELSPLQRFLGIPLVICSICIVAMISIFLCVGASVSQRADAPQEDFTKISILKDGSQSKAKSGDSDQAEEAKPAPASQPKPIVVVVQGSAAAEKETAAKVEELKKTQVVRKKADALASASEAPEEEPEPSPKETKKEATSSGSKKGLNMKAFRWRGDIPFQQLEDGSVVLQAAEGKLPSLRNSKALTPPFKIEAEASTDSTNVRIYYGKGVFVFGWESKPGEFLCLDPATKKRKTVANVPFEPNVMHKIEIDVEAKSIFVKLDGKEICKCEGDYESLNSTMGIGPALGSKITVKSLAIKKGKQAE